MTEDFTLWKSTILQLLRRVTTLCASDGPEPTFGSLMQELYGDAQLAAFIKSKAWLQAGLSEEAGVELTHLQQQFDAFDEPDTTAALLTDPQWRLICTQVGTVILLLEQPAQVGELPAEIEVD